MADNFLQIAPGGRGEGRGEFLRNKSCSARPQESIPGGLDAIRRGWFFPTNQLVSTVGCKVCKCGPRTKHVSRENSALGQFQPENSGTTFNSWGIAHTSHCKHKTRGSSIWFSGYKFPKINTVFSATASVCFGTSRCPNFKIKVSTGWPWTTQHDYSFSFSDFAENTETLTTWFLVFGPQFSQFPREKSE